MTDLHAIKVLENLRKRIGEAHNWRKTVEIVELSQGIVDFLVSDSPLKMYKSEGSLTNGIYGKTLVIGKENRIKINSHWHSLED